MALPGRVEQLATGTVAACARLSTGSVYCWGSNVGGQLGTTAPCTQGTTRQPWQLDEAFHGPAKDPRFCPAPIQVAGLTDVIELAMGREHACARRRSGEVLCWGANGHGQLGDGTRIARPTPTRVRLATLGG